MASSAAIASGAFVLLGLLGAPSEPEPASFYFRPADHPALGVSFELEAPLGKIEARAEAVEGELHVEAGRAKGRVRVRVDGIRTGIEGRDRDLRKPGWLDARRWPYIGFVFEDVPTPPGLLDGGVHEVEVAGRLILHGVEQRRTVRMRVQLDVKEGVLVCEGEFPVRLEDHRLRRSDSAAKSLIGLRVGEVATVKLRLRGRRG